MKKNTLRTDWACRCWSDPPFYKTQREWIGTLIKCREHLQTHRRWGRGGKHIYIQAKINKEKLGPRQLYCTDVSIRWRPTSPLPSLPLSTFSSSALSRAISSYIVQYDMEYSPTADCTILYSVTNKHKKTGKKKKVSPGWLAPTVSFPSECLFFLVRQVDSWALWILSSRWEQKQGVRLPRQRRI